MKTINKLGVNTIEGKQVITTEANINLVTFADMESIEAVDPIAVADIELTIISDRNSYEKIKSLFVNYAKKEFKGEFNEGLALKGIKNNIVDTYLKGDYKKYFGTPSMKVNDILCLSDRYKVAYGILEYYQDLIDEELEKLEESKKAKNVKKLDIKKVKDCWGSTSYMGYFEGKQYTECHDTIEEIKEKYKIFSNLEIISKNDWNNIHSDYKGIYSDFQGTSPHLKGLKTKLKLINGATCLVFEGIDFIILD